MEAAYLVVLLAPTAILLGLGLLLRLPTAGWVAASLYSLFVQPILVSRFGIPAGSLMLGVAFLIMGARSLLLGGANSLPPRSLVAIRVAAAWFAVALAASVFTPEWPLDRLVIVITTGLVVAVPLVYRPRRRTEWMLILAAPTFALFQSSAAVVIEQVASPTLFGLIGDRLSETSMLGLNPRVTALHYNSNGGAFIAVLSLPGALALSRLLFDDTNRRSWRRWLSASSALLLASGALFVVSSTGSRAGYIACLLILVVVLVNTASRAEYRRPRQFNTAWRLVLVGVGSLIAATAWASIAREFSVEALVTDRSEIWADAWAAFAAHPMAGSPDELRNAHNAFLEAAALFGVGGIAALVALLFALRPYRAKLSLPTGLVRFDRMGGAPEVERQTLSRYHLALLVGAVAYSLTHVGLLDASAFWLQVALAAAMGPVLELSGPRLAHSDRAHSRQKL